MRHAKVGEPAPEFDLPVFDPADPTNLELRVTLAGYRESWLILFFYPLDFTFVCPTEITAFSDQIEQFHKVNCEVLACSVDSQFTHLAWINTPRKDGGLGDIKYPLLADVSKKICTDYGVKTEGGIALR